MKKKIDVLLGLQFGDEGKGKLVDYFAGQYDIVARFQGGPNAGHTLYWEGKRYVLHVIPSGVFSPATKNIIGNNVLIDPILFLEELASIEKANPRARESIFIAKNANLIMPTHRLLDLMSEKIKGDGKIGSTQKGIGPAYRDKTGRDGIRIGDAALTGLGSFDKFLGKYYTLRNSHLDVLKAYTHETGSQVMLFDLHKDERKWIEAVKEIREMQFIDCAYFVNKALDEGQSILAEGAQGTMLDIDLGTYPFVTSSNTTTGGVCTGLGVSPHRIGRVIGITKAYATRVGSGPFPTELFDQAGKELQKIGAEFGATTGRPRRCGWIDLPQLKYAVMINGVTELAITKLDVLDSFQEIKVCTAYAVNSEATNELPFDLAGAKVEPIYNTFLGWEKETGTLSSYQELPLEAKKVLSVIEEYLKVPVAFVSVGSKREQLLVRDRNEVKAFNLAKAIDA